MLEKDLSAAFPPVDYETWKEKAIRDLRGAPFEKTLIRRMVGGLTVPALSGRADWPADGDPSGLPGAPPFTRGATSSPRAPELRVAISHPDPAAAADEIREAVAGGATGVELRLDPTGAGGVIARSAGDTAALGGALQAADGQRAALSLSGAPSSDLLSALSKAAGGLRAAGLDPFAAALRRGGFSSSAEQDLADAAALAAGGAARRALAVDAGPLHDAGADPAQDLGWSLAVGAAWLRALEGRLDPGAAIAQIELRLRLGGEVFLEIARLRAARALWGRLAGACGAAAVPAIHARLGDRHLTRRDPWVNMLRNTAACFAGIVGGADAITPVAFDAALAPPGPLGRRVARNTGLVLLQESHLHRVLDPAGGSWSIERLTEDLAARAWGFFQAIEGAGGAAGALRSGWLQAQIAISAAAQARDVARRKAPITGVSEFPILDQPDAHAPVDRGAIRDRLGAPSSALAPDEPIAPLAPAPLAAPFEALRDRAEALEREDDDAGRPRRAQALLATLGPLKVHTARATWIRNLLAAGGIRSVLPGALDGAEAAAAALTDSGATIAVICSSDAVYAERAADVARALKAAGASAVLLAGRPGALEAPLREAGVDRFVYAGCDVLEALSALIEEVSA